MKRKLISIFVTVSMLLSMSGCHTNPDPDLPEEPKQVVLLCEPLEDDSFLRSMTEPLEELLGEAQTAADYTVVECEHPEEMEEAALAKIQEGCDLLLMVGQRYSEIMSHVAEQFPESTSYVLLDGVCENENVGSYIFRMEELAYLTGIVAASVGTSEEFPHGPLGSIHVYQDQNSFAWRWGYMEGARSVNSQLEMDDFHFAYTKSYDDKAAVKAAYNSLKDKGCRFINNDVPGTEQSHLILRQVKMGDVMMRRVLEDFLNDDLNLKIEDLGLKEDALNLMFAAEDLNTAPEDVVLTPEILTNVQEAAGLIKSGKLKLDVPLEEDYSF